jgi:hypothetical protein
VRIVHFACRFHLTSITIAIDHLKELLATRQELVSRVQDLRAGDSGGESPWERLWDGGTGLAPEGDVDDDEEDGEGESDEAEGQ